MLDVTYLRWLFRVALRAQDQEITLCADNEPARMAQGVSSVLHSLCTRLHMPRDSWRANVLPGRPKQTLHRQAVRGRWSVPCLLLLQIVPFQSNVDVATEVLPRDSPHLLGSCTWDRQRLPKSFCAAQSALAPSGRTCYEPSPWEQDQGSTGCSWERKWPRSPQSMKSSHLADCFH